MTAMLIALAIQAWIVAILLAPFLFVWVCLRYLGSRSKTTEVRIMNKSESNKDRPQ